MNKLFDTIVIGNSSVKQKLETNLSKNKISGFDADNILYLNYQHGVFISTLKNKDTICSKSVVLAFDNEYKTETLEKSTSKIVVIYGDGNEAAEVAINESKTAEQVIFCIPVIDVNWKEFLNNELICHQNIVTLFNSRIKSIKKNKDISVELDTYTTLDCSKIVYTNEKRINSGIFKAYIDLDDSGYATTDQNGMSAKVPGIFAIGDINKIYKNDELITRISDSLKFFANKK